MLMSEDQYLRVRDAAKQIIPEHLVGSLDENKILVAVLFNGTDLGQQLEQEHFLWLKGKPKTLMSKVREKYEERQDQGPPPRFVAGASVVEDSAKLSELNFFGDKLVVLMVDNEPMADDPTSAASAPSDAPAPAPASPNAQNARAAVASADPSVMFASSSSPALQARPALSVGTSPAHSRQSSIATSARPSPSLLDRNGTFTGNGGLGRHSHLTADSPLSFASTTPTPTHASLSTVASTLGTPQPQPNAAPPAQSLTQHVSPHSPYRQLPTPQSVTGLPGTPANAQEFPGLIYGSTPSGPHYRPQGSGHPGEPPMKPYQQPSPIAHHGINQPALNARDNPAHQAPAPVAKMAKPELQNRSLETLMLENDLECLEAGVKQALRLLGKIEQPLEECQQQDQDAKEWLKCIHNLKSQNLKNRTILGVVGNTGAGKSSVINAILDEERLVPTNCMRACTAVVTELSWNESNDRYSRYRAEIEFIKYDDWLKELQVLYSDLLDGNGNVSRDSSNSDSEAGVAWAKIKAVYPQKTREMIAAASPKKLAQEVQSLLGTTKQISQSDPADFYKRLQFFVDSQEKQKDSKEKKRMEYWPLIKVVKIYTKADALSTGAVVVDLPGVQDSNAARAAVAEGYMKQCSGLWIVAPITRAVDDKAAKKLLGDTFKRQLKLDGTYNNVTFICSKTDDISLQEAVSGLNLDETVSGMWSELDDVRGEIRNLQKSIEECKESRQVYSDAIEDCDEKIDVWDKLLEDCADGKIVYALTETFGRKRKRSATPAKKSRKKPRSDDSDDDFIDDDEESEADSDATRSEPEDETPEDRDPLAEQQIQEKVQELKDMKKEAKSERGLIDEKLKEIWKEVKTLKDNEASIDNQISRLCINGRNDYSRGAIKQDFAAGIRELDQETAEEEDAEAFDPEVDLRDYDEVARSLPVFCVSSRAYQKLCGRLKRDKPVPGFKDICETEVPKLQAHCKQLTEAGRIACARRFLTNLSQFLTSMNLWATNEGSSAIITADQRRQEQTFLKQKLEELRKNVEKVVHKTLFEMAATLAEDVYSNYEKVVQKACEIALPTASGWGAPRSMGGLYWSTYKATVRRGGVYSGASGPRDFNAELPRTAPILKDIATGWERAFQRRLPTDVRNFKANALRELHLFHNAVAQRARRVGVSMARLNQLDSQLRNHEGFLNELVSAIVEMVNARQKEVNREFVPVVASAMEHAYQVAADERGTGSYARMKSYVTNHVSQNQDRMFRDACKAVKARLDQMCGEVQQQMTERATIIYDTAHRDYNSAVGNLGAADVELSPTEKKLRDDVEAILKTTKEAFERVLGGEENPDEVAAQADENVGAQDEDAGAQDEDAGAQDEDDQEGGDDHSTVKQEPNRANDADTAEHPLGRTLAEELLAAQNGNKENAASADANDTSKSTPKTPGADAAARSDGSVLGEIGSQAINRPAFGDAGAPYSH